MAITEQKLKLQSPKKQRNRLKNRQAELKQREEKVLKLRKPVQKHLDYLIKNPSAAKQQNITILAAFRYAHLLLASDDPNMIISSFTGSGKTIIILH